MKGSVISGGAEVGIFDGHVIQGGSAVKLYDGYCISGGQAVKIYQSAVEWTYGVALSGDQTPDAYGNGDVESAFVRAPAATNGQHATCAVTYTFDEPLLMRAGSTLTINTIIYNGNGQSDIFLDGTKIYTKYILWSESQSATESYTFASDTIIDTLTVQVTSITRSASAVECHASVTVNSEDGSFLLNNSGIHEIQ